MTVYSHVAHFYVRSVAPMDELFGVVPVAAVIAVSVVVVASAASVVPVIVVPSSTATIVVVAVAHVADHVLQLHHAFVHFINCRVACG